MENDPPAPPPTPAPSADSPDSGERPARRRSRGPRRRGGPEERGPASSSPDAAPAAGGEAFAKAENWAPRSGGEGGGRKPREEGRREGRGSPSSRPRERERSGERDRGGRRRAGPEAAKTPSSPDSGTSAAPATAAASKPPAITDERAHLAGPLLTAVSRSFSISIKLLPEELRGPISLGYLLARALDTVADAPAAPAEVRLGHLRSLLEMLKYGADATVLRAIERALAPGLTHAGEKELLGNLGALFGWLESLDAPDRWDLQRTLARIGYGQELDLRRFGGNPEPGGEIKTLATAAETHDYAYLVAGSAGEFWTRLCERHLKDYSKLPGDEMLVLGKRLGQGLQLVNILRDLPRDLAAGRCYLPAEDLAAAGLTAADLLENPPRARPLLAKWRAAAVEHLDAGWRYVQALKPSKLRYACALPALLAVRTLELLAKTSPLETPEPVKVPRSTLRRVMLTAAAASVIAPRLLDRLYRGPRKAALGG